MKKITTCSLFAFLACGFAFGSDAIDFDVKDLSGKQHHLFDYLQSNKYVLLEFTAKG